MSDGTSKLLGWLIVTVFIYLGCSFISWNIEIDEWSGLMRGIFIVLSIAYGIILLLTDD